jgi:hypothetical protein
LLGSFSIVYDDGTELRIDPYTSNALLLIDTVGKRLYLDDGIDEV